MEAGIIERRGWAKGCNGIDGSAGAALDPTATVASDEGNGGKGPVGTATRVRGRRATAAARPPVPTAPADVNEDTREARAKRDKRSGGAEDAAATASAGAAAPEVRAAALADDTDVSKGERDDTAVADAACGSVATVAGIPTAVNGRSTSDVVESDKDCVCKELSCSSIDRAASISIVESAMRGTGLTGTVAELMLVTWLEELDREDPEEDDDDCECASDEHGAAEVNGNASEYRCSNKRRVAARLTPSKHILIGHHITKLPLTQQMPENERHTLH